MATAPQRRDNERPAVKHYPVAHPFLFAAYSVAAVLATFPSPIFFGQAARLLAVVLAGTGLLAALAWWAVRDWPRAGYLASLGIFVFTFYGHLTRLIQAWLRVNLTVIHDIALLAVWAALLAGMGSGWVWRRVRPHIITGFLDIVSAAALLFPMRIIILLILSANRDPLTGWTRPLVSIEPAGGAAMAYKPDIYYIIVDGYGRADVLNELYQFDNSEFLDFLTSRGFYVASQSQSNYIQTSLSLPASLNLEYINYLGEIGKNSWTGDPSIELMLRSRAVAFLREQGYKTFAFSTGFFYTEMRNADVYLSPYAVNLNEFEQLWLATTAGEILVELGALDVPTFDYAAHRRRILYTFERLPRLPDVGAPRFVFAHIMAPHPPFLFGPHGEAIESELLYTQGDGMGFGGTPQEYIQGYVNQLRYINTRLQETLDGILKNSRMPPVIIVQGDHGPALLLSWESPDKSCMRERLSILNAYYMPGGGDARLYASITPVNSFRVVFDAYLGADLGLLDDKSYYSNIARPYDFIDVTAQGRLPCAAP